MIHPLWRASYFICACPPGAKLSPNSILINSSGMWYPLVSNPVILIVYYSYASNIILVSSVSDAPYRSNHSYPIWYSWTMLCQDFSLSSFLFFQGLLMWWFCDVISLCPVPFSSLVLVTYIGAWIMYMFDPLGIGCSPAGDFHSYGFMYVALIFLCYFPPILSYL